MQKAIYRKREVIYFGIGCGLFEISVSSGSPSITVDESELELINEQL